MLMGDIGVYDGGFELDAAGDKDRVAVKGDAARLLAMDSSVGP